MSRHLWLDPGFGASGDMVLGALLGLGAPLESVRADLATLDLDGWRLDQSSVQRAGISATRAEVDTDEQHHHRTWSSIDALLAKAGLPKAGLATAGLPAPVAAGARRTFELLGRVEADIHAIDLDQVHFHEVGALDAIVDIVGAWSALHHLGVTRVTAGAVGLGSGVVQAAHGRLPAPAPATVALLVGASIRPVDWASETVTPTGAALLRAMVETWGPIPAGRLVGWSRGAGGRNPESHPNVLGALLIEPELIEPELIEPELIDGKPVEPATTPGGAAGATGLDPEPRTEAALVLSTNLDDATPEIIGHTISRLLEAGADDAWVVGIGMKKNRPGHELRVLCRPALAPTLEALVFAETGTLGLRRELVAKQVLTRRSYTVELRGHPVRMKAGPYGTKPEHDDLVALSRATGLSVRRLAIEATSLESGAACDIQHRLAPE